MSERFPSQTQDKFTVRFPDGMRDAVADRAKANGRSMNSEIIQILQDALDGAGNRPITANEALHTLMGKMVSWYSDNREAIERLSNLSDEEAEKIVRDMKKKKPE